MERRFLLLVLLFISMAWTATAGIGVIYLKKNIKNVILATDSPSKGKIHSTQNEGDRSKAKPMDKEAKQNSQEKTNNHQTKTNDNIKTKETQIPQTKPNDNAKTQSAKIAQKEQQLTKAVVGKRKPAPLKGPLVKQPDAKYPASNGVEESQIDNNIYISTALHQNWKQIYVDLPEFYWETPKLLTNDSAQWFWKQSENYRHFQDTINPITGSVRVIENGQFRGRFAGINNQTHYTNINTPPEFTQNPQHDIAFYLTSHQTEYFQHFLDNGIPHIALMLLATGFNPKDVTMVLSGWSTDTIPAILKRWGFKEVVRSTSVSAKTLVLPEIVPVIHTKFYDVFVEAMKFDYSNADKIIFVSRKSDDTSKNERIIKNQDAVVKELYDIYKDKLVVYTPKLFDFHKSFSLFEKATLVIGSHGGAMYNSMFSSRNTKIIEIIPVVESGLYFGQGNGDSIPRFAHLAMYTNAELMHQPFYRFYQVSSNTNMDITIPDFVKFVEKVLKDR